MLYMVTFTINIPQMLVYIPYMDPMGENITNYLYWGFICLYSIIIIAFQWDFHGLDRSSP